MGQICLGPFHTMAVGVLCGILIISLFVAIKIFDLFKRKKYFINNAGIVLGINAIIVSPFVEQLSYKQLAYPCHGVNLTAIFFISLVFSIAFSIPLYIKYKYPKFKIPSILVLIILIAAAYYPLAVWIIHMLSIFY